MNLEYEANGYFVIKAFFNESELQELRNVLLEFHASWKNKHFELYSKQAVNSAYITDTEHLTDSKRDVLFKFIGSRKLMDVVLSVIPTHPCFMNTQLFFNPADDRQKNYWHRDPQYHLSIEEQRQALSGPEVVHLRIPLASEPGLELVPGTHNRWDTNEEFNVRLEKNNRKNYENISTGVKVDLSPGDLLVFSANMIHRGLYGMDRFSFDILFCEPAPSLIEFISDDCLPPQHISSTLENATAFTNTRELKKQLGRRAQ